MNRKNDYKISFPTDLHDADLRRTNLSRADLCRANLRGADMSRLQNPEYLKDLGRVRQKNK